MFFYSPNARPSTSNVRRATLSQTAHLNIGHLDTRLSYQIPEILSRHGSAFEPQELLRFRPEELRIDEQHNVVLPLRHDFHAQDLVDLCASPVSSVFSANDPRRSSRQQKIFLRRPTISIQDDGKILIGEYFFYAFAAALGCPHFLWPSLFLPTFGSPTPHWEKQMGLTSSVAVARTWVLYGIDGVEEFEANTF